MANDENELKGLYPGANPASGEGFLADDDFMLKPSDLERITVSPAAFADLHPRSPKEPAGKYTNGHTDTANLDLLLDIGLQITVELGRAKMTIKDVLSLGPGRVVELNRTAGEPVDILINGKVIAKGEVVVLGDMFGVRVTDIIPPAQRVQSMV